MILAILRRGAAVASIGGLVALGASPAGAQSTQRPAAQPARPSPGPTTRPAAGPAKPQPAPQQPAAAAARPAQGGAPAGATLIASFGDWGVYTAQSGRTKICYALTQPKERLPKALTRDPAYLFVSFRPTENVRNEVALVMGFQTSENSPAEATIGQTNYALLTKEQNAWLKNPAEESQAITTMAKGQALTVKVQSRKGNQLTDRYSLNGFSPALERARKECS